MDRVKFEPSYVFDIAMNLIKSKHIALNPNYMGGVIAGPAQEVLMQRKASERMA